MLDIDVLRRQWEQEQAAKGYNFALPDDVKLQAQQSEIEEYDVPEDQPQVQQGQPVTNLDALRKQWEAEQGITSAPRTNNKGIAGAKRREAVAGLVHDKAAKYGLDPDYMLALVEQESGFNPEARSPKGAIGLMQLMPGTAKELGVDPTDPEQNVEGGMRYYRQQLDRFGGNRELATAAYNAGPNAVARYGGVPPYDETRNYLKLINEKYAKNKGVYQEPQQQAEFSPPQGLDALREQWEIENGLREKPEEPGMLGSLWRGLKAGAPGALDTMLNAAGALGMDTDEYIDRLEKWTKENPNTAPPKDAGWARDIYDAAESTSRSVLSHLPGAAVGGAVGGPLGAGVGAVTSGPALFALAEYNGFLRDVKKYAKQAGVDPEEAVSAARDEAVLSGLAEGGFELAGDLAIGKILGVFGKGATSSIRAGLKESWKKAAINYAKKAGKISTTEALTEAPTGYVQTDLRQDVGIPTEQTPMEAGVQSAKIAALTGPLFGLVPGAGGGRGVETRTQEIPQQEEQPIDLTDEQPEAVMPGQEIPPSAPSGGGPVIPEQQIPQEVIPGQQEEQPIQAQQQAIDAYENLPRPEGRPFRGPSLETLTRQPLPEEEPEQPVAQADFKTYQQQILKAQDQDGVVGALQQAEQDPGIMPPEKRVLNFYAKVKAQELQSGKQPVQEAPQVAVAPEAPQHESQAKEPWQMTSQEYGVGEAPEIPDLPRTLKQTYGKNWEERPDAAEIKKNFFRQSSVRAKALKAHKEYVRRSNEHFNAVKQAYHEGKPVPQNVLDEYGFKGQQSVTQTGGTNALPLSERWNQAPSVRYSKIRQILGRVGITQTQQESGRQQTPFQPDPQQITKAHQAAAQIAKTAFGKDTVWYDSEGAEQEGIQGFPLDRNTIAVSIRTRNPVISVVMHEATHQLQDGHPDLYARLKEIAPRNYDQYVKSLFDKYESARQRGVAAPRLTDQEVESEFWSDVVGEEGAGKKLWTQLGKQDPDFFKRLVAAIKQILDDIRRRIQQTLKGNDSIARMLETENYFEDLDLARKRISEVLAEFSRRERGGEQQQDAAAGAPFSIAAKHGSGKVFDRFSNEYIGTGEGAQAFGWGHYFTEKDEIARHYARAVGDEKAYKKIKRLLKESGLSESDYFFDETVLELVNRDGNIIAAERELADVFKIAAEDKQDADFYKQELNKVSAALANIKNKNGSQLDFQKNSRNLYNVTIHKGKEPGQYDYLRWDEPVPKETLSKIKAQANKELKQKESLFDNFRDKPKTIENFMSFVENAKNGADLYGSISRFFGKKWGYGADKEASLFLLRAGIDGIKYPAGTLSGVESDAFNYVVFDPNEITIDERTPFSLVGKRAKNWDKMEGQLLTTDTSETGSVFSENSSNRRGSSIEQLRNILQGDSLPDFINNLVEDDTTPGKLGSSPEAIDSNIPSVKSHSKGVVVGSDLLRDIVSRKSFLEKGYGGLDVKTQRSVLSSMVGSAKDDQVFDTIIKLIPIDVMNLLKSQKLTPKMLFHDQAVLRSAVAKNLGHIVSGGMDVPSSLVRTVALARAIVDSGNIPLDSARVSENILSTIGTIDFNHNNINTSDKEKSQAKSSVLNAYDSADIAPEDAIVQFGTGTMSSMEKEASKITDTPAFKKWFAGSKVVDENGEPLVVAHSTPKKFTVFKGGDIGFHFGTEGQAAERAKVKGNGSTIYAYLSIKNPLRLSDWGSWGPDDIGQQLIEKELATVDEVKQLGQEWSELVRKLKDGKEYQYKAMKPYRDFIESKGYDGIVYANTEEVDYEWDEDNPDEFLDSYIAFSPTQIKSVNNTGTFDETNPDIRYSLATPIKDELRATLNAVKAAVKPQDATFLGDVILSPEHWKNPKDRQVVDAAINREQRRHQLFFDHMKPTELLANLKFTNRMSKLRNFDRYGFDDESLPKAYRDAKKAIIHMDVNEVKWDDIKEDMRGKVSKETWQAIDSMRTELDRMIDLMRKPVQDVIADLKAKKTDSNPDPEIEIPTAGGKSVKHKLSDLVKLYREMGQLKGFYFPRIREAGDIYLTAKDKDGRFYRFHKGSRRQAEKLKLQLERRGFTDFDIGHVNKLPDIVYQDLNMIDMGKAIEYAINNSKSDDPSVKAALRADVLQSAANMMKARAFRSHKIARTGRTADNVVRGYIEDPLEAYTIYLSQLSGGIAKGEAAQEMYKGLMDVNPAQEPMRYKRLRNYIQEQLRNPDKWDRAIALGKSLVSFKFLGLNPRSALVNTTAQVTTVPPAILKYALGNKGSLLQIGGALIKSGKDYGAFMRGNALQNTDEQKFMADMKRDGYDNPQLTHDAMRNIQGAMGGTWSKIMEHSMYLFGKTEQWNRGSTLLAAYRLARKQGQTDEQARKSAIEATNKAHGIYGKATLPTWAQGDNPFAKLAQLGYTYSKFGHNYVQMLLDHGISKDTIKGLTYAIVAPSVLGGATSLVGYNILLGVVKGIMQALGDDREPEKMVYDRIRKEFGDDWEQAARYGIAGAIGVDLSGSLGVGMEIPKSMSDLTGPFGGVYKDLERSWHHIKQGNLERATEEVLPNFFKSIARAYREINGATTTYGNPIWDADGKPYVPDKKETALRAAGFRSSKRATLQERAWESTQEQQNYQERKSAIYEKYRNYLQGGSKDKAKLKEILDEVAEFNKTLVEQGKTKLVPPITREALKRQARSILKPNKRVKARLE